ncbi:MAG: hypothetical protein LBK66_05920 [Spirochaetaceae bacterium]|jgi:hypothetical protein|nr:hypothetical protein [Spirochaetaceae bacterium]
MNPIQIFQQIVNLVRTSTLAKIILAIVLLLIVLIIVLPLIGKLKRKHIKTKETKNILRDLMVWRHVAQLAQGGETQNKAKGELSDNLVKIDNLLKQGFELAAAHGRGIYGIPWFMLLGEPNSGKSSLLNGSELELIPSAVEKKLGEETEKKSLPVRLWIGGKAVICDVSGSVFFDRWLGGSSAEWYYIIKELCRRHYKMPLNGIILTIPADALLADSSDLTHKKAVIMANEIAGLLTSSGMRLPCYVVVTKLDMVEGFMEYAGGIFGELRHQILGFENDSFYYNPQKFKEFWNDLLNRLRSGYKKSMLSRVIAPHVSDTPNRMDAASKMFLFPENFAGMYDNLIIYLDTLFSEDNFHGTKETIFDGLFFTSAFDIGISLSPAIAALAGKSADDFQLADKKSANPRSYFIRNTLQNFIFNPSPYAGFIREKALIRSIPAFALCGIIITIGFIFFLTAVIKQDELKISLSPVTNYYNSLASSILNVDADKNPIIVKNGDGTGYMINTVPVSELQGISPVQFYSNTVSAKNVRRTPPLGFLISSLLVFQEFNMGMRSRTFITDMLYDPLILAPLIKSTGDKLILDVNNPPVLDEGLRSVIQSFVMLDGGAGSNTREVLRSIFSTRALINYVLPGISNDSTELLNNSASLRNDDRYTFSLEREYVYTDDFSRSKRAALEIMLSDWQNFSVYPNSLYGRLKSLVQISQNIVTNYSRIEFLLNNANNIYTLREVQNFVDEWNNLISTQNSLIGDGVKIFHDITGQLTTLKIPLGTSDSTKGSDPFGDNIINDYIFNDFVIRHATEEYSALFQRDMRFITNNSDGTDSFTIGLVQNLTNDFSYNIEKEIANLRTAAQNLKTDEFLSSKLTTDANSPSLFTVVNEILKRSDAVDVPDINKIKNSTNVNWMNSQYNIVTAFNNFENYVKPFADNDKVSNLINNSRIALAAEAYINRYVVLTNEYEYLSTSSDVIEAMVSSLAENSGNNVFSLSSMAIRSILGDIPYDNGYDPTVVTNMINTISAYNDLFSQNIKLDPMPRFLQNHDMNIYQTDAFSAYLDQYINYWASYSDNAYTPVTNWPEYKRRVTQYKPYQINSVLQTLYSECIGILNDVNDIVLSNALQEEKKSSISMLNDKIKLLSSFMSVDAGRMLSDWSALSDNYEQAFMYLRSRPMDEIKNNYMTVYSDTEAVGIGWWNGFIMDGFTILSKQFCRQLLSDFSNKIESFKMFPLLSDGNKNYPITQDTLNDITLLLGEMGADSLPVQSSVNIDPVSALLHPMLFDDINAQNWAERVYKFASAAANTVSPLTWTLTQPALNVQDTLSISGRQLAVNRFRYIEVSTIGAQSKSFNTAVNEELTLAAGKAIDKGISLKFYRSSADRTPQTTITVNDAWSIFDFYLNENVVTTDAGTFFPVLIGDNLGNYAYFMGIKFNRDIPKPGEWYSSTNWPPLRVTNDMVTSRS